MHHTETNQSIKTLIASINNH